MESPILSPGFGNFTGGSVSSNSRSSTKLDDITSLTSFNPFSEEDENDQSSYTLVTSLFSRMKNSLAAPLSAAASGSNPNHPNGNANEQRRPSATTMQNPQSNFSTRTSIADRPTSLT